MWVAVFKKFAKRREPRGCVEVGLLSEVAQLLFDVFESRLEQPGELVPQKPICP